MTRTSAFGPADGTAGPRQGCVMHARYRESSASLLRSAHTLLLSLGALAVGAWAPAATALTESQFWATDGAVYASARVGNTLIIGGDFTYVGANIPNGAVVDDEGGVVQAGFPTVDGELFAVVSDGSGGWILGGAFSTVGGIPRSNLARIRADKTVDPGFLVGSNGPVYALLRSPDGAMLFLGGDFTSLDDGGPVTRNRIAAVAMASATVTPWDPGANAAVRALVLASGTLYVGGEFNAALSTPTIGGATRNYLAALDTGLNTNNATAWDPGADGPVRALALASNALTLYAGGDFSNIGSAPRNYLAALDTGLNTNNATSWDPGANGPVRALALGTNTLYVGGDFNAALSTPTIGGATRNYLAALDIVTDTNNATAWDPGISGSASSTVNSLVLSGDGRTLFVGGEFTSVGTLTRFSAAAIGTPDANVLSWNPSAVVLGSPTVAAPVNALAVGSGEIYLGGAFTSVGGGRRTHVAGLQLDTRAVAPWSVTLNAPVHALLPARDGSAVYIAGDFTEADGKVRNRLARLTIGSLGTGLGNWSVSVDGLVRVLALANDGLTLYVGGDFSTIGSVTRNYIGAVSVGAVGPTPWDPGADGPVRALALSPDGNAIYVGGQFTQIGGAARANIAALSLADDTNNATDWDPGANGTVKALALTPDGGTIYVGGDFLSALDSIGGADRDHIAAVTISERCGGRREDLSRRQSEECTNNATPWNPGANGSVSRLRLSADGTTVVVGGDTAGFSTIGGANRNNLAELLTDGMGPATAWNPDLNGAVMTLTTSADGTVLYVGGTFSQVGGASQPSLAGFARPAVTAAPAGGNYNATQDLVLSCTAGPACTTIHYTTDGTTPTTASPAYTGPITLALGTQLTVKSLGIDASGARSIIRTDAYHIEDQPPSSSTQTPGGILNITNNPPIVLNCDDGAGSGCAAIFYTTDGSEPTQDSNAYLAPLRLSSNTTLKFFAVDRAGNVEPTVHVENYTVDLRAPVTTISPLSRPFHTAELVLTLTCDDGAGEGCADTFYTLNGSDPIRYVGPFRISDSTVVHFYSVDRVGNTEAPRRESYVGVYGGYGAIESWFILFIAAFWTFGARGRVARVTSAP